MDVPPRRVGLLIPSSNTVMEPDFVRGLPPDVTLHTSRMMLDDVTADGEARMLDEATLPAARALGTAQPRLTVFGCTSAGALRGLDADAAMSARIAEATGAPTVSVIQAVRARLAALGVRRLAVATPYTEALTARVVDALADRFEVVAVAHLGLSDNRAIGDTPPARVGSFVRGSLAGVAADGVFVSCTNFRAVEALDELASALGMPVTSSNAATLDAVNDRLDAETDAATSASGVDHAQ